MSDFAASYDHVINSYDRFDNLVLAMDQLDDGRGIFAFLVQVGDVFEAWNYHPMRRKPAKTYTINKKMTTNQIDALLKETIASLKRLYQPMKKYNATVEYGIQDGEWFVVEFESDSSDASILNDAAMQSALEYSKKKGISRSLMISKIDALN